jgi:hypothetical protein
LALAQKSSKRLKKVKKSSKKLKKAKKSSKQLETAQKSSKKLKKFELTNPCLRQKNTKMGKCIHPSRCLDLGASILDPKTPQNASCLIDVNQWRDLFRFVFT